MGQSFLLNSITQNSTMKFLFAVFVVSQLACLAASESFEVDWFFGMEPWEKCVNVGDEVVFVWNTGLHNVIPFEDYEGCSDMSDEGANGEDTIPILMEEEGVFLYACGVPAHCTAGGMKAKVTVGNC